MGSASQPATWAARQALLTRKSPQAKPSSVGKDNYVMTRCWQLDVVVLHQGKPASLVAAQPRDQRRSPETATEMVYWTGGSYTKGPGVPLPCAADGRQDMAGRRRLPSIGGIHIRWAHQLPVTN